MKNFCHNCGKQMPSANVNFCPYCGTSLSSLSYKPSNSKPNTNSTFVPFTVDKNEDNDVIDVDKIQHLNIKISELQVDIIKDRQQTETIATLTQQGKLNDNYQREGPYLNIKSEEFLKEFQKEAGALRP